MNHNHVEQRYDPTTGECPACDSINAERMTKDYALTELYRIRWEAQS